jgi:hypothetical protein
MIKVPKNAAYSDLLYVSELIGLDVVTTMPDHTLQAFADHGEVAPRSTPIPRRPYGRSPRPRTPGSTSLLSPLSSSARASSPSATPTTNCSTASRGSCHSWATVLRFLAANDVPIAAKEERNRRHFEA